MSFRVKRRDEQGNADERARAVAQRWALLLERVHDDPRVRPVIPYLFLAGLAGGAALFMDEFGPRLMTDFVASPYRRQALLILLEDSSRWSLNLVAAGLVLVGAVGALVARRL